MENFLKVFDNKTRLRVGPARLSYTHVFKPYVSEGSAEGKYQTNILISKEDTKTIEAVNAAIEAAIAEGVTKRWKGNKPKKLDLPLRDGDEKENGGEAYADMYFLNAKTKNKPQIVDKHGALITDEEELYSGVWAIVTISFYAYDVNGNKGIACALDNLMKYKDDTKFGGGASAATDFADIHFDDDDDL